MALAIKDIPILTGKNAEKFNLMASKNQKKSEKIDFSIQQEIAKKILEKAKI